MQAPLLAPHQAAVLVTPSVQCSKGLRVLGVMCWILGAGITGIGGWLCYRGVMVESFAVIQNVVPTKYTKVKDGNGRESEEVVQVRLEFTYGPAPVWGRPHTGAGQQGEHPDRQSGRGRARVCRRSAALWLRQGGHDQDPVRPVRRAGATVPQLVAHHRGDLRDLARPRLHRCRGGLLVPGVPEALTTPVHRRVWAGSGCNGAGPRCAPRAQPRRIHSMRRRGPEAAAAGSRRDRLLACLYQRGLQPQQLHLLRLCDVVTDPTGDYLEAATVLRVHPSPGGCRPSVPVDDTLRVCLEDYLNAPHQGRPFLDWRPEIGTFLFPSACTGEALSRRTLRKLRHDEGWPRPPRPPSGGALTEPPPVAGQAGEDDEPEPDEMGATATSSQPDET